MVKNASTARKYLHPVRLFFSIPLPEGIREKLFISFPEKKFHGIRFTPQEQLHVTVHFLGRTEEQKLQQIISSAGKICIEVSCFEMKFASMKIVPTEKKPEMIWAQFETSEAFEKLSLRFREVFPTEEKRKPNPHVTLARIKQLRKLPLELPKISSFQFIA